MGAGASAAKSAAAACSWLRVAKDSSSALTAQPSLGSTRGNPGGGSFPDPAVSDRTSTHGFKSSVGTTCYLQDRPGPSSCSCGGASRGTGRPLQRAVDNDGPAGAAAATASADPTMDQAVLSSVSDTPGLGLSESAEILLGELDASLVSIHIFYDGNDNHPRLSEDHHHHQQQQQQQQQQRPELLQFQPPVHQSPPCAVLLAAFGAGADILERSPVITDPAASCLVLHTKKLDSLTAIAPSPREGDDSSSSSSRDAETAAPLPADWDVLHRRYGLQSFLAVPIGPAARPWGVLTLAAEAPDAASSRPRWQSRPSLAAVALVHLVRHWQSAEAARLLYRAAATEDCINFVTTIIHGTRSFMERALNTQVGVRLALMGWAPDQRALIFEPRGPGHQGDGDLIATDLGLPRTLLASALAPPTGRFIHDCTSYMQSSPYTLHDVFTNPDELVSSLVVVPLVVHDAPPVAAIYLSLPAPNSFDDVQTPLLGLINVMKGFVTERLTASGAEIWQRACAVRKAAADASPALQQLEAAAVRSSDAEVVSNGLILLGSGPQDSSFSPDAPTVGIAIRHGFAAGTSSALAPTSGSGPLPASDVAAGDGPCFGLSAGSSSGGIASCRLQRACTRSMLKAAEQKIFAGKIFRRWRDPPTSLSSEEALQRWYQPPLTVSDGPDSTVSGLAGSLANTPPEYPCNLTLEELIGVGGYGTVWRGTWRRVTAAIKVMHHYGSEQGAHMDAVEMAVLSAVNHPNVLQVFACLTDVVEIAADANTPPSCSGGPAPPLAMPPQAKDSTKILCQPHWPEAQPIPRYRRLLPSEDPAVTPTCSVVVMEYCDLGSLRRMAQRGLFHRCLGPVPAYSASSTSSHCVGGSNGGAFAVNLAALVEVALQVAEALAYLHSIGLCHCDVKLDNVLLKTEVSQPYGYIAKLVDMGLVKVLGPADAAVNVGCTGTVNYMAPELFTPGSRITTAVDVYAYGILLYELYMAGASAYAGLSKPAIIERVLHYGMRPRFPIGAPQAYVDVASSCWAQDPAHRPGLHAVIASLDRLRRTTATTASGG